MSPKKCQTVIGTLTCRRHSVHPVTIYVVATAAELRTEGVEV